MREACDYRMQAQKGQALEAFTLLNRELIPLPLQNVMNRHPGENRDPCVLARAAWIPAFAGMTNGLLFLMGNGNDGVRWHRAHEALVTWRGLAGAGR